MATTKYHLQRFLGLEEAMLPPLRFITPLHSQQPWGQRSEVASGTGTRVRKRQPQNPA